MEMEPVKNSSSGIQQSVVASLNPSVSECIRTLRDGHWFLDGLLDSP